MDEIRECETQLAEIRKELESVDTEELRQVETELVGLIAELKDNLPKFKVGDEVSTKTINGKIVDIIGSKMYKVQPYDSNCEPKGKPVSLDEASLRANQLSTKQACPNSTNSDTTTATKTNLTENDTRNDKKNNANESTDEEKVHDEFEENKNRWKHFAQKTKKVSGINKNVGRVAKQPQRRAHFVHKRQ